MIAFIPCGRRQLKLDVPDDAVVYETCFPSPPAPPGDLVREAVSNPIGTPALVNKLAARRPGPVVVVVSDVTRPIPYASFLPVLLAGIESAGVAREEIAILIATGMHRPSTPDEREMMFGREVADSYRIVDHRADRDDELAEIPGRSRSGGAIRLNRLFVEAGFRIVTGLVEPHFMAGFSGGRKAVCPGLCSLNTIRTFHGYDFLADPAARNGNLAGNPLHEEALSIARQAGVDFCLNVVLNRDREVIAACAGDLESSHEAACRVVREGACPAVARPCDVVLTSSGGYPLDATFYQCVKGIVGCLPAVRKDGAVIAVGGCAEGIGSQEYIALMRKYADRRRDFLEDIRRSDHVLKDQWELQMQTRALAHVGRDNLYFVTDGLDAKALGGLSVHGIHAESGDVENVVQDLVNGFAREGCSLAVIPEGPYCTPLNR